MRKHTLPWGFPGGAVVKKLPVHAGDRVQSLGWQDPLEKEMAIHSRILAWKIAWTEEPIVHGAAKSWTYLNIAHTHDSLRKKVKEELVLRAVKRKMLPQRNSEDPQNEKSFDLRTRHASLRAK